MITVNYRDCKHEHTFTVKTKRGTTNVYCSDCFKWLRAGNKDDLKKLKMHVPTYKELERKVLG